MSERRGAHGGVRSRREVRRGSGFKLVVGTSFYRYKSTCTTEESGMSHGSRIGAQSYGNEGEMLPEELVPIHAI